MKRRVLALVVLITLVVAACSNGSDRRVLATVDGVEISMDTFIEFLTAIEPGLDEAAQPGADALADFDTAGALPLGGPRAASSLGTLIQLEAARDEARALGVETPVLDSQEALDVDIPAFLNQLRVAVPSEADLERVASGFLDSRPCSRHILLDTDAAGAEVLARLGAGEEFATLAGEVSTDPGSGAQGGDLGCNDLANFDPAFAAGLFELEVGDRSGVVESSFGFHIIERTPPPAELTAEAETAARDRLVQDWFNARALEAEVELDPAVGTWSGTNIVAANPDATS